MPYIKRTVKAGPVIEIRKSFSSRYGSRGEVKRQKINLSPEAVQRINEKNAEEKLRWLLLENFRKGDWHLVITYRKTERPNPDEAKKILAAFLRDLRKEFRKNQGEDLRYIAVTEWKSAAIHHHIVIPTCDIRIVQKLWRRGKVRGTDISDEEHLISLASYLIKETSQTFREGVGYRKRWNASRNLKRSKIKTEIISQRTWVERPKPVKGYRLDKRVGSDGVEIYENAVTGSMCQFYRMIRIE